MKGSIRKKLKLGMIMALTSLSLTTCGDIDDVVSGYRTTIGNRVQYNLDLLKDLQYAGLITEDMYDVLEADIKSNTKQITKVDETDLGKVKGGIIKSATSYRASKDEAGIFKSISAISGSCSGHPKVGGSGKDKDDCQLKKDYPELHQWVQEDVNVMLNKPDSSTGKNNNPKAIDIFSSKDENNKKSGVSINTVLNAEIYVLNSEALEGTDLSEIAEACNTIKELKDKKGKTNDEKQELSNARSKLVSFKPSGQSLMDGLADKQGNPITALTHETSFNDVAYNAALSEDLKGIDEAKANGANAYEIGKDLAIFSNNIPVFALRLFEINPEAVDALIKKCKESGDAYLIDYVDGDSKKGVRIYKMFYPVNYVESFHWDSVNKKTSVSIKESEMMHINIMTGEAVSDADSKLLSMEEKNKLEKLYNVLGNADNNSSFDIWKIQEIEETMPNGEVRAYQQNTILLKDYLEYTYLPEYIAGEPFVALGRRIRLYNLEKDNTISDPLIIGKFIDKTGKPVEGAGNISVDDLLDIKSGNPDNERRAIRLSKSKPENIENNVVSVGTDDETGFASDKDKYRFLEVEYKDEIFPVSQFPIKDTDNKFTVAEADAQYNNTNKSRIIMYGICVDGSMFASQLYSGWIDVAEDEEKGCLNWWNTWLEQAKYYYHIDTEALSEYLGMNYTADMLGEDKEVIILDEDTLAKIQKDMNRQDEVHRVTFIRTMFVIIGYLTMVYAFLFLAAWVIDVSTIGETKIMTIMSLGRCVAIRDKIERPFYNESNTAYLTFSDTLIRSITLLVLSLVLTRLDFIAILVKSFGKMSGVTQEIFKRIFNI
jgi:hypothetical protein